MWLLVMEQLGKPVCWSVMLQTNFQENMFLLCLITMQVWSLFTCSKKSLISLPTTCKCISTSCYRSRSREIMSIHCKRQCSSFILNVCFVQGGKNEYCLELMWDNLADAVDLPLIFRKPFFSCSNCMLQKSWLFWMNEDFDLLSWAHQ